MAVRASACDRDVGAADLVELGAVNVDVNDASVGSEAVEAAGDAIVKTGTERDQQVTSLHGGDGAVVAVHAGHAEGAEGASPGRRPRAIRVVTTGNTRRFRERASRAAEPRALRTPPPT
jgi:hypothetical protein